MHPRLQAATATYIPLHRNGVQEETAAANLELVPIVLVGLECSGSEAALADCHAFALGTAPRHRAASGGTAPQGEEPRQGRPVTALQAIGVPGRRPLNHPGQPEEQNQGEAHGST